MPVYFSRYSFLPPPFAFAIKHGGPSSFEQHIASMLKYPPSTTVAAVVSISCTLVPFSGNDIGEQISLPLDPSREYRVQCTSQVFRRSFTPGFLSKRGARAAPV